MHATQPEVHTPDDTSTEEQGNLLLETIPRITENLAEPEALKEFLVDALSGNAE